MYNNQLHLSGNSKICKQQRQAPSISPPPALMTHNSTQRVLHFPPDFLTPSNMLVMSVLFYTWRRNAKRSHAYGEEQPWDVFPKLLPKSQPGALRQEHYYTRGYAKETPNATPHPFKNENKEGKNYLGEIMWLSRQNPHFPFKITFSPTEKQLITDRKEVSHNLSDSHRETKGHQEHHQRWGCYKGWTQALHNKSTAHLPCRGRAPQSQQESQNLAPHSPSPVPSTFTLGIRVTQHLSCILGGTLALE